MASSPEPRSWSVEALETAGLVHLAVRSPEDDYLTTNLTPGEARVLSAELIEAATRVEEV